MLTAPIAAQAYGKSQRNGVTASQQTTTLRAQNGTCNNTTEFTQLTLHN